MAEIFDFAAEAARRSSMYPTARTAGVLSFYDHDNGGIGVDACISSEAMTATDMFRRIIDAQRFEISSTDGRVYLVDGAVRLRDVAAIAKAARECGVMVRDSRVARSA